ncbi:MAG: hypothetical protein ABI537_01400 [Casimicrobiaceae bacterium]
MGPRKFSLACVGLILALVGGVGVFNRIVDPFWYFRDVEIAGINRDKPKAPGNERLVKPALMHRLKPEAMIVGSSFAEVGLPPLHPGFTRNGQLTSYNFGMPAARWSEVYCQAMFALRQLQLKRLVVGVSGMDSAPCPTDAELGRADYGKLLFSRTAFEASRETLRAQGRPSAMTREGLWYYYRYDEKLQSDDQVAGNFALEFARALCPTALEAPRRMDPARIDRTPAGPAQAAGLRNLIRRALEHNVELVLLLYPTHVLFNEIQRRCESPEAHWNSLWQAVSVANEEAGDRSQLIQIWDFFGYGPLNAERMHAGKPMRDRLWQDFGHFNEEIGTAAFNAIYLGSTGYGTRVTVGNFDELVARTEEERRAFLAANSWVAPELRELVLRTRAMSQALGR